MDDRTHKRLVGMALYWLRKFRLHYDMLDDLINEAWLLWLERPQIETERRFQQVHSALRRFVLTEQYGRVPHGGKIPELPLLFRGVVGQSYEADFTSRVVLREVTDVCRAVTGRCGHAKPQDHMRTVAMIAGLAPLPSKKKTFKERRRRLHNLLRAHGLTRTEVGGEGG